MTCIISNSTVARTITITVTNLDIPVVTLLTRDNVKVLQQLKSYFKRTIKWNKYQSKVSIERQNQYLDYVIDHVLSFGDYAHQTRHSEYVLPTEK